LPCGSGSFASTFKGLRQVWKWRDPSGDLGVFEYVGSRAGEVERMLGFVQSNHRIQTDRISPNGAPVLLSAAACGEWHVSRLGPGSHWGWNTGLRNGNVHYGRWRRCHFPIGSASVEWLLGRRKNPWAPDELGVLHNWRQEPLAWRFVAGG